MCRSLMPRISAACHQVIFFAVACNFTSCTFIARSIAALGYASMLLMVSHPHRPQSGHITCYLNRTYHVLPTIAGSGEGQCRGLGVVCTKLPSHIERHQEHHNEVDQ